MDADGEAYQRAHGEWMRNQTGSELAELHVIGLVGPLSFFVLKLMRTTTITPHLRYMDGHQISKLEWIINFLGEFILIVVPQLAAVICSCFADHLYVAGVAMCMAISLIFVTSTFQYYAKLEERSKKDILNAFQIGSTRQDFLTSFRACVLLLTVICILAVDFPVFPRRFAKTETYGTSLMDGGVGMFVISNAIVSPEARSNNRPARLTLTLLAVVPLLVLGVARVVVLKSIGYHENLSEYGTHWNFFFTLAFVRILATLIFTAFDTLFRRQQRILPALILTSVIIMSTYQFLLSKYKVSSYIMGMESPTVPATILFSFLHSNRGGLFSCAGYLSLYLVGVCMGRTIFAQPEKRNLLHTLKLIGKFFGIALLMLLALPAICAYIEPVSRRLANLGYVVSVISIANTVLPLFIALDLCAAILTAKNKLPQERKSTAQPNTKINTKSSSAILDAVNRHGLAVFLLANVLTGIINVSVSTIYAPTSTSVPILVIYVMFVTLAACIWQQRQIKTKLW